MSNERSDDNGIDNDELGQRLRDATPKPGADYWAAIDEALADLEGDTDRSVVRPTSMTEQVQSSSSRRFLLAGAAAVVAVLGAAALAIGFGDDNSTNVATETPDVTQPVAEESDEPSGDLPGLDEVRCYRVEETPNGVVVRLTTDSDGTISAATFFDSGGADGALITVAEGRALDDGLTLQMLEVPVGEGVVSTRLWQLNSSGLFLFELGAVPVDCGQVTAELAAIDAAIAAQPIHPIEEMRERGELSGSNPAVAAGTYCFVNDDEDHPSERLIQLTVADDGTAAATTSDSRPPELRGEATGSFATPTEMVMTVERFVESQPPSTSLEVWRVVPLTGELIHGPLGFVHGPIDCAEVS